MLTFFLIIWYTVDYDRRDNMARRKFKKNNRKRNFLIQSFILLFLFIGIGYATLSTTLTIGGNIGVSKVSCKVNSKLYNVLKCEAENGEFALKYNSEHQDSFDASLSTKNIYYWNPTSGSNATTINDMNNVIFGNYCWKILRTTDTGGVKLIYNGEVDNGKCLDSRGNHEGYAELTTKTLSSSYYYGTSYYYDNNSSLFVLDGTITTGEIKLGQYTCLSSNQSDSCSTIYFVDTLNNNSVYNVISIDMNSHYSQIGTVSFHYNSNSLGYSGYQYNAEYVVYAVNGASFQLYNMYFPKNNAGQYYYSDTIDYGETVAGKYTLHNPSSIYNLSSNYTQLEGKYILPSGYQNSATTAYYVDYVDNSNIHAKLLENGDLNVSMCIGDSYVANNDDTYTLQNAVCFKYEDWFDRSPSINNNKYVCDGTSPTCHNLKHIYTSSTYSYYYYGVDLHNYLYAESVKYENGTYSLQGDIISVWDYGISDVTSALSTHHYSCLNQNTSCANAAFLLYTFNGQESRIRYVLHRGKNNIQEVLDRILQSDTTNSYDSVIKKSIDIWYQRNLLSYSPYIEDTIYCNDRVVSSKGAWEDTGTINKDLSFRASSSLKCERTLDQFSTSNPQAHLSNPVGLLTYSEARLEGYNLLKTGKEYWLMTPHQFYSNSTSSRMHMFTVSSSSSIGSPFGYLSSTNSKYGVRPVISLVPDIEFSSGDGSMNSPYVVDAPLYSLTIHYRNALTGDPVADDYIGSYAPGASFSVPSPTVSGMNPSMPVVVGTMTQGNMERIVTYS